MRAEGPRRRAGDRAAQHVVGDARAPRRPRHLPRRRHRRLGGRRPARLPRAVARGDAAAGVEPRRQAADELLRPVAGHPRHARSTTTASRSSGSTSSATSSTTRRTSGRSRKAPRACSSSRRRSRAGRSGAGSTCRRSRCEAAHEHRDSVALDPPAGRRPSPRDLRRCAARAVRRHGADAAVHAHRLLGGARRRRSARRGRPVAHRRARLGRDDRLPAAPLVARPRRRRGDGHGAARHGARLADLARADPPLARRGARHPGRAGRLGLRHRPPRASTRRRRSTTSSAPTKSRWRRSSRSAAG